MYENNSGFDNVVGIYLMSCHLNNVVRLTSFEQLAPEVLSLILSETNKTCIFNPFATNGISHFYQMGKSIFILGSAGVCFHFDFIFRRNLCMQTEKPQMGRRALWRHIWDYSVCLCPTKRTLGLYGLTIQE